MQLDLKNVRVTYTIREVIAVIGLLCGMAGTFIRSELRSSSLEQQVQTLRSDVADCKRQLAEAKQSPAGVR